MQRVMEVLTTTYRFNDNEETGLEWTQMMEGLTDVQCQAGLDKMRVEHLSNFAPPPGQFFKWAKGNQRQTVTSDYLMDFYSDEQGRMCVPSVPDDKGEIKPALIDQPNSINIEVGHVEYQRRMKQLRDLMAGTLAMEGNYASLQRSQIHRRNEMRRELGWG